ncbi:hypothetical protein SMID22_02930 [Streptococcus mitis]|uniref:DUF6414 family protein n=1 Tax=Streptococcus mitis TaxID=28037 RepID=UPI00398C16B9
MLRKNKKPDFIKLVYFDEVSATDLVYFKFGGNLVEQSDQNKEKSNSVTVGGETSGKIGSRFFNLFNVEAGIEFKENFNKVDGKIVRQVVTNTVVTDYLNLFNQKDYKDSIYVFDSLRLSAYPNSLSQFKLKAPYLSLAKGAMKIDENLELDIATLDSSMSQIKGYYELVGKDLKNKDIVLRFNLSAFRNNYSLGDVVQMDLTFHAIKVGKINLNALNYSEEFSLENVTEPNAFSLDEVNNFEVEVYDVILAGVPNG